VRLAPIPVHHHRDFYYNWPNSGGTTNYAFVPFYGRTRFVSLTPPLSLWERVKGEGKERKKWTYILYPCLVF
jgi:hypothetical protein